MNCASVRTSSAQARRKNRGRRDSDADTDEAEVGKERPNTSSPVPPQESNADESKPSREIDPSEWAIHFQVGNILPLSISSHFK